jgi:hypothetical protein
MSDARHGLLNAYYVELPFETPEAQAEADKTNAELKSLGFRTFRGAYEWGYSTFDDIRKNPRKHTQLKSGDLVKIFKTVSDGDVAWSGKIDYSYKKYHHGLQKRLKPEKWSGMFNRQLPAKLEQDGKTIFGALEPFCETGTEGVIWSLHEYGKNGYDGLNVLKKGDLLTVYNAVRDGEVEWEGTVDFGPEKVEKMGWSEVMRQTNHMDTQKWLDLSWQRRPVIVTPK